jgi:peptidoglycan/xylan/chitin deacetylase (PgdA/CDA1 family)
LKRALRTAGIAMLAPLTPLARRARARRPLVLAYHDPEPGTFEAHLETLERHYHLMPLAAVLDAVGSSQVERLPRHAVAITIDDGHARNRDLLEVCRRHGVSPTIFMCTRTGPGFWWSGLGGAEQRRLKRVPDSERRLAVAEIAAVRDVTPAQALTDEDVRVMAEAGIDFEPHTRTHPVLPRCDEAVARDEIAGSKADLEALLGRTCDVFAYPNGDYNDDDVALVAEAGYRWAFTTRPGFLGARLDPLRLPRIVVRDDMPAFELLVRAGGMPGWIQSRMPDRAWSALQVR